MDLGLRIKCMMRGLARSNGLMVSEETFGSQAVLERLKIKDFDASTVGKLKARIIATGPATYFGV